MSARQEAALNLVAALALCVIGVIFFIEGLQGAPL